MRAFVHFLIMAFMVTLMGCSTTTSVPTGPLPDTLALPDATGLETREDLRIGPADLVSISVFGVDELNGEYQVDYEGYLKMPLIGEFPVQGLTAVELATYLETTLGEKYLQDPDVSVLIADSRTQIITIDGAVENPGQYNLPGQMSLLQAVALSGGPTKTANAKRVVIFRTVDGQRMVAGFDLQAIRSGEQDDPRIYGNDVIVVDGSEIKGAYQDFLKTVPLLSLFLLF